MAPDTDLSATLQRALDHHKAGRYAEALPLYRELLQARPDEVGLLVNHGIAALQAGRPDLAVDSLRRAVAVDPGLAPAHLNLANVLQSCGRLEDAAVHYRRALELDPTNPVAYNNLGVVVQQSNRAGDAVANFREAIVRRPDYAEAYVNLCQAYRVLGDLEAAIATGRRAVEHCPAHSAAHDCLGSALSRAGRFDEAIPAFQRALAIDPKFLHAQVNLAKTLLRKGDPGAAVRALDACLESYPGDSEALATKCVALNELGDREALDRLMNHKDLIAETDLETDLGPARLADFNRALARHVETHPTLMFEPERNSTKGGLQSGNLAAESMGPIADLERIIGERVKVYLRERLGRLHHPFLERVPARTNLQMWGVVLKSQGHQTPHIHSSAWISGCYYLQVPEAISTATDGHPGWIEFGHPHPRLGAKAAPVLTRVRPAAGRMLLFPSFFYHSTVPFEAAENRISIAFDVIPCA